MNRETQIVRNTLLFIWNTSWEEFCQVVFDVDYSTAEDHKKQYLEKYLNAYSQDPASLFAILDYDKMDIITEAAVKKYGLVMDEKTKKFIEELK
tara:strand:- start:204 stop:485 length:282 start_codon:yes stop_codon:yes gene_type:complete